MSGSVIDVIDLPSLGGGARRVIAGALRAAGMACLIGTAAAGAAALACDWIAGALGRAAERIEGDR